MMPTFSTLIPAALILISSISEAAAFLPVPPTTPTSRCSAYRYTTSRRQSHPDQISELLQDFNTNGVAAKAILLDVRELEDWTAGHLQAATPAPLSGLKGGKWMDSSTGQYYPGTFPIDRKTGVAIAKNLKIYLIHDDGKQAEDLFAQMGYSNVVPLSETYGELATAHGVSTIATGGVNKLTDDNG